MRGPAGGFTLLEVMIALAVVSLGMLAAFGSVNQSARGAAYLRDKTFATWVAENVITELRVSREFPEAGESDEEVEFAGQRWRWEREITNTEVEALRRVDVRVSYADRPDEIIATLSGFIVEPGPEGGTRSPWHAATLPAPPDPGGDGDDNRPEPPPRSGNPDE